MQLRRLTQSNSSHRLSLYRQIPPMNSLRTHYFLQCGQRYLCRRDRLRLNLTHPLRNPIQSPMRSSPVEVHFQSLGNRSYRPASPRNLDHTLCCLQKYRYYQYLYPARRPMRLNSSHGFLPHHPKPPTNSLRWPNWGYLGRDLSLSNSSPFHLSYRLIPQSNFLRKSANRRQSPVNFSR